MENTNSLRAIIVDDELLARKNLSLLLKEYCPSIEVIDTASDIIMAEEKILDLKPQVVFLDIRMPSGSEGFDLLRKMPNRDFQVVFVTAFKDYAVQAFNANAVHYILKPIDIDDLQNAEKKLIEYNLAFEENKNNQIEYQNSVDHLSSMVIGEKPKKITLYHSKGFKIIDTDTIIRVEAQGNYTCFFFNDGAKYMDSKTLKINQEFLPGNFVRTHKSFMINMDYLVEYKSQDGHFAILKDKTEVPISRGRLSEFITKAKTM